MKFFRAGIWLVVFATVVGVGCQPKASDSDGAPGEGGVGGTDKGNAVGGNGGSVSQAKGGSGGGKGGSTAAGGAGGVTHGGAGGLTNGGGASGGTGGMAGAVGGASGGMTGGGGATTAACEAPSVCDDFEGYVAGGGFGAWKQNGASGTMKVDKTHAFSGQQAVQIVSPPGGNQRMQLQRNGAPLFPVTNNVFWGRMMVWANQLPGKSDKEDKNVHYDIVQATGTTPGEYRVAGMGGVLLNYEPHDCYYGTSKVIPQNKWTCWEWLYDGSKNTIEFYIDGQLQARVANKGQGCVDGSDSVWAAPAAFNQLRVGFVNYQSKAETTTLWIDDFAGGPTRLGCPRPSDTSH